MGFKPTIQEIITIWSDKSLITGRDEARAKEAPMKPGAALIKYN